MKLTNPSVVRMAVLPAIFLLTIGSSYQDEWKRVYVGGSDLSFELPGVLSQPKTEKIEDEEDWVAETTDWTFERDAYVLMITKFSGKPDTVVSKEFLKKVEKDYAKGLSSEDAKLEAKESKPMVIDKMLAVRSSWVVTDPDGTFQVTVVFVGFGKDVFAVSGVTFPGAADDHGAVDRIVGSVRCKKGLPEKS